jgi:phosphatidylserine/phosphatidylglycerophosphate/cardiolipin synthase-like enzyme
MKDQNRWRSIILSGTGYGGGLAVGSLLAYFLLNNQAIRFLLSWLDKLQLFLYLIFGLALVVIIIGLGGGIGGAIGGWVLSGVNELGKRRRFAWRSSLSFFIAHAILVLPFILITVVIGFLNQNLDVNFSRLPALFAFYGLIYGAVAGLLLGLLAVGLRQMLGVFLAALFGFGLGGWLMGAGLYFYSQLESPGRLLSFLFAALILFVFGTVGGGALGFAAQYVHDSRALFPQTRGWRIFRNITLVVIALYFLFAIGRLVETLTIRPADLAETLPLPTEGTHWLQNDSAAEAALDPEPLLEIFVDGGSRSVEAICDQADQIIVTVDGAGSHLFAAPRCHNEPVLALDEDGDPHLVWYSDEATKVTGILGSGHFLYESIGDESGWTEPAIIARPSGIVQPALNTMADGSLQLVWDEQDPQESLYYVPYNCDEVPLTELGNVMYEAVRQEKYRPASDPIPYCQNHFDRLLFTPNPTNPESDLPKPEYGAFDHVAELVTEAEYEVLFTTMQWDKPTETFSPGLTLTTAVAELYEKVKTNPEAYPRGMTVRILLGNVPELAVFEPTSQIINLLQDLHDAGITEMVDEEIGWNLEVANFGGAWPHAHSKFVVVDGKTAVAAGFNYSYLHLPKDHPSGLGLDMNDLGIQITGPLAQTVLAAYDDLWSGSDLYTCSNFPPPLPSLWFLWCDKSVAKASHTPEVLRFFPTDGNSNAFALHHTMAFLESDEAIVDVLLAAQETIDVYEVNFSLDLICIVSGLLGGLCDTEELAPPYMQALLAAMVENDVKVRVLAETSAMNGLENRIAINWLKEELEKAGKTENVQFKFYNGKMHDKGLLIDDQLLIIGSQNFHWSAWDTPSLTEYNVATEDPEAIFDFLHDFEYQWDRGIPWQEAVIE